MTIAIYAQTEVIFKPSPFFCLRMSGRVQPKERVQYDYLCTSTSHIQMGKLFLKVMWFISKLFYLQWSFNNKYDLLHNGKVDQHHAKERVHQVLNQALL